MKDGLKTLIFIAVSITAIFFFIGYLQKCSDISSTEQTLSQVEAALNDTVKHFNIKGQEISQKVVDLSNMNSEQDKLIKGLEFKIFSKNREIVRLETIISSGYGYIDTTINIDSSCIGLKLAYQDSNLFRILYVGVTVDNPPIFNTSETFQPFGLTTYLSRDKKGIWIGHALVDKEFQSYIKIDDIKVEIEKDEFNEFYDKTSSLKLGPDMSIYSDLGNTSIFNFGIRSLVNETHDFSIQKSLNTNGWLLDYSYLFDFIK